MQVIVHEQWPAELWRPGVSTRMLVSGLTGAGELCVFEQVCDPGCGAPAHRHTVEEVLTVCAGQAEVWLGDDRASLTAGQSVVVPPGVGHGFSNVGGGPLHVRAVLAAPVFEAAFDGQSGLVRRWAAGA